ncbi:cysteine-rich CWC family protein [Variovorax sp. WS11]|uniref:cysteine-rich CWC family protein n=1 Tax=Variovorax sp. WS11 TaxID=1105204 RepID=UPI00280B5A14|nr:cysteine-rich CWC family protein [Variovorax sp. WS11]
MGAKPSLDASRCPVCGEANRCAIELERETGQAQRPCWCMQAGVSREALARVPPEARGLACICARCAMDAVAPEPVLTPSPPGRGSKPYRSGVGSREPARCSEITSWMNCSFPTATRGSTKG